MIHKFNTHSSPKRRNIRPEKVVEVLARYKRKITLAEAELILEITYKFAKLYMENIKNGGQPHPSPKRKSPRSLFR